MAIRISYITITNSGEPYERIKTLSGVNNNGTRWTFSQQEIIDDIESGQYQYYVAVNNQPVRVIIAKTPSGKKYLKTEQDAEKPDTLLSLPCGP